MTFGTVGLLLLQGTRSLPESLSGWTPIWFNRTEIGSLSFVLHFPLVHPSLPTLLSGTVLSQLGQPAAPGVINTLTLVSDLYH